MLKVIGEFTHTDYIELIKIVLDKGIFAILLALFGLFISKSIERYKSERKIEENVKTIFAPKILELMETSENIYHLGVNNIRIMNEVLPEFFRWAEAIYKAQPRYVTQGSILSQPAFKNDSKFADQIIQTDQYGLITIDDLLRETAGVIPRQLLENEEFFNLSEHYELEGFFLTLHNLIIANLENRNDIFLGALRLSIVKSVFSISAHNIKKEYHDEIHKFRLSMMRKLPIVKDRADIAEKINYTVDHLSTIMSLYPAIDIVRGKDGSTFDTLAAMATAHGALMAQFHRALNAY